MMKLLSVLLLVVLMTSSLLFAQVNLDSALVAYYPFNGNASDESGKGLNGAVVGATSINDRFSNPNSAYEFDGTNDYVEIIHALDSIKTISFWVKGNWTGNSQMAQVASGSPYFYLGRSSAQLPSNTALSFTAQHDQRYYWTYEDIGTSNTSGWNNIVISWKAENSNYVLHYNGKNIGEARIYGVPTPVFNFSSFVIGQGASGFFTGQLDDFRFYNYSLSDNTIQELYHESRWPLNELIAYYPFNGNASDESGNGNNGIVQNDVALTSDRFGNLNSAYEFDGINDRIDIPSLDNSGSVSVSLWHYFNGSSGGGNQIAFIDDDDTYSVWLANFYEYPEFNVYTTTQRYFLKQTVLDVSSDIGWHHFVLVFDNENNTLTGFIDNENIGSTETNGHLRAIDGDDGHLGIGGLDWDDNSELNGRLDDIRVYNYALSENIIDSLYHENGYCSTAPNLSFGPNIDPLHYKDRQLQSDQNSIILKLVVENNDTQNMAYNVKIEAYIDVNWRIS